MKQFTPETYKEAINSDKLTLIKFFGTWCGPCRVLSPILEDVISEFPGLNAGEIDIDQNIDIAVADGIRGVPTVVFYKNGQIVDRVVGLQSNLTYIAKIKALS